MPLTKKSASCEYGVLPPRRLERRPTVRMRQPISIAKAAVTKSPANKTRTCDKMISSIATQTGDSYLM